MALQTLPWAIQGQSHSAEIGRNVTASLLGAPAAAFTNGVLTTTSGGSHGVVNAGDMAVTQNGTPNMSVNIAAGRAFVRSGNASSLVAGVWACLNDATVNVAIAAADPTNPRIDLVVLQVRDTNYGEAASDNRFTVVTGTPAASPAVPSLASYPNALVLAQVAVAAGVTSITNANITDKRTWIAGKGGVLSIPTFSAAPTGAALEENTWIYERDADRVRVYDGTGWVIMSEPLQTYTPSWTNVTQGTGPTNTGQYHRSDGYVDLYISLTLGTGGVLTGQPTVTTPVNLAAAPRGAISCFLLDAGTNTFQGVTESLAANASSIAPYFAVTTATLIAGGNLGATAPFTWAVGDEIRLHGRLRMNSRYS